MNLTANVLPFRASVTDQEWAELLLYWPGLEAALAARRNAVGS